MTTLPRRVAGGPLVPLAVTVVAAVAAVAWAYGVFGVAAAQGNSLAATVVVAALPAALAMVGQPQLALAAVAATLISNAGLVLNQQFGVPSVVRASVVLAVVAVAVHPVGRRRLLDLHPVMVAFLAFVAVRIGTSLAAPTPVVVADQVKQLLFGVLIVGLLGLAASTRAWAEWCAWTLAVTGAVLCTVSLAYDLGVLSNTLGFAEPPELSAAERQIQARSLEPLDVGARTGGPVAEPNFWAQILVLTLPLAIWCMRSSVRGQRIVGGVLTLAIVVGIAETGSRGGLLALAVTLAVLGIVTGGRARRAVVLIPIALAIGLVASGNLERFQQIGDLANVYQSDDPALKGRASENIAALEMLADHPLTGVGAGNYPREYLDYVAAIGLDDRVTERQAHNSYLEMAAESGLPGAAAFIALFAVALIGPFRNAARLRALGETRHADLAVAVGSGFAGYCLAAVFLHQGFPEYGFLALGLCAMATNLGRRTARTRGAVLRRRDTDTRTPVAWLVGGFPATADDPVVEEVLEIERNGGRVEVFAMSRQQAGGVRPEAAGLVDRATFVRLLSPGTLGAQADWMRRSPRRYVRAWRLALRGSLRDPLVVGRALRGVPVAARFARRMRRLGVVHVHAHGALEAGVAARVVETLTGIPYSVTVTRPDLLRRRPTLEAVVGGSRFTTTTSAVDADVLDRLTGAGAAGRVRVVRPAVDLSAHPPRPVAPPWQEPFRILCPGALHEGTGHEVVIRAAAALRRTGLEVRLDVVGDGEARQALQALAGDGLVFHGVLTDGDLLGLMDRAHLVVLPGPAREDEFDADVPPAFLRAMARGVTAVAPDAAGIREVVADGRTGVLFRAGDVGYLAYAVRRLANDPTLAAGLAAAGGEHARRLHDPARTAEALRDLIADTLDRRPADGARR